MVNSLIVNHTIWLILGIVLGVVFLLYARSGSKHREIQVLSAGLVVATVIYVGFAIIWGGYKWILIELAGVSIYGLFAWLALRFNYNWLVFGWATHPAWDLMLHFFGDGRMIAPEWYVIACISFDFLIAAYIIITYKKIDFTEHIYQI